MIRRNLSITKWVLLFEARAKRAFLRFFVCTTLLFCLFGCSTLSPSPTESFIGKPSIAPKKNSFHRILRAQGSLGVRTPEKGWSASFDWRQKYPSYQLSIFGPLGSNPVLLTAGPFHVTLETRGKIEEATNAEMLLKRQLGWYMPVNSFPYWIQGFPAPNQHYKIFRNAAGKVIAINQQNWHIEYQEYDEEGFPMLITLYHEHLLIRIAIRQWSF